MGLTFRNEMEFHLLFSAVVCVVSIICGFSKQTHAHAQRASNYNRLKSQRQATAIWHQFHYYSIETRIPLEQQQNVAICEDSSLFMIGASDAKISYVLWRFLFQENYWEREKRFEKNGISPESQAMQLIWSIGYSAAEWMRQPTASHLFSRQLWLNRPFSLSLSFPLCVSLIDALQKQCQ